MLSHVLQSLRLDCVTLAACKYNHHVEKDKHCASSKRLRTCSSTTVCSTQHSLWRRRCCHVGESRPQGPSFIKSLHDSYKHVQRRGTCAQSAPAALCLPLQPHGSAPATAIWGPPLAQCRTASQMQDLCGTSSLLSSSSSGQLPAHMLVQLPVQRLTLPAAVPTCAAPSTDLALAL